MLTPEQQAFVIGAARTQAEAAAAAVADWSKVTPRDASSCPGPAPRAPESLSEAAKFSFDVLFEGAADERWRELCAEHGVVAAPRESGWAAEARAEDALALRRRGQAAGRASRGASGRARRVA